VYLKHAVVLLAVLCLFVPSFDLPPVYAFQLAQQDANVENGDSAADEGTEAEEAEEEQAEGEAEEPVEPAPPAEEPEKPQEPAPPVPPVAPQPEPPAAPAPAPAPPPAPLQPQPRPQIKPGPTVNFFFDDADIYEVIQTVFGDVLRVNYIIDPQVKGRVNFRTITPIPKEEVLPVMEIILRLNGIGFVEEAGLYRIIPLTDVPRELIYSQIGKEPENVAIEMFIFKNLDLKESMPDIENALGLHLKGGAARILPIFRLNALIVVASSEEQMEYIRKWVEVFDTMFSVARQKIYVYPLQNSKAPHVASLLQSIFTGTAPAPTPQTTTQTTAAASESRTGAQARTPAQTTPRTTPRTAATTQRTGTAAGAQGAGTFVSAETRVFPDEITNSLIILAIPAEYSFIEETIKRLDIMPRQVVIEGVIARVTLTDNLSFGVSWSLNTDLNITNIKPFSNDVNLSGAVSSIPSGTTLTAGAGDGFTFVGTDPSGVVRAKLTAALRDSRAKILASPHILVSDNREARIQVGSQVPLATSATTYVPTSGDISTTNPVTSTIQYKDIGIILTVKPQINDSGLVFLELSQEVSSLGTPATIAGQDYSSIDKTETTTNLVAQDGETIIIGGLIREDATKEKTGIPFISRIPLLGSLFSFNRNDSTRTELIILLTPHVLKTQRDALNVTGEYIDKYQSTSKDKEINEFIGEKSGAGNGIK
jgi:general secretion pathway protein D